MSSRACRGKRLKTLARVVAVLALCACATACTKQGGSATRAQSGTLVVALSQEPISLNPLYLEGPTAYTYSELIYSYLTTYDSNGDIVGDLAAEAPTLANRGIGADGLHLTYHLRRNVRWQDGATVTARDVVFSYRAVMNPNNSVPERYGYDVVSSVRALDPYTVLVTLKHPFSPIVSFFFGGDSNYPILPAHLLERYSNLDHVAFNGNPIGSGPFKPSTWERGDHIDMVANDSYYGGKPGVRRLALPFIHDDSTVVNELMTGEVNAAFFVNASRIAQLRGIPNHRIVVTPVPYFYALSFNVDDPLLSNLTIRRAFVSAIDRRAIVRRVTLGIDDPDTGARGLFTWAYDPTADRSSHDPARAARMLSAAGWIVGPDGIRTKDGRRLRLQLSFPTGSDITERLAVAIVAAERDAGIDLSTKAIAREQYQATDGPILQGRYQVSLYDYQSSYDPDASWLLACDQRSPGGFNEARYCNRAVDAALERAAASYDRSARIADYREVQRHIAADVPYFFLCQVSEIDVIPSTLRGYARPLLSPFASAARWRLN